MSPLNPKDWQRLEPLFDQILDLDPDQREAWLQEYPDLNESDRTHLRDLLAAHEGSSDRWDQPLPVAANDLVASIMADPLIGENLGPFRVEEEIGRGGMGVVYRGVRIDGEFTQEVVIKVLRLGIDSEATRRRFIQERQILANLDHPSIVRLLDGGFTGDGRPYLVMNRVSGLRIDEYCDQKKLDVKARVRLFLNVIEAVGHAHLHLIIHRDLKPSNVWVDDSGKAHLLDFGIAKIVDEGGGGEATLTQQRVMTPEFASPEQFGSGVITTATDVYQLGALLYRLLTGQNILDLEGRSPAEMEQIVRDTDPMRSSQAATSTAGRSAGSGVMDADSIFDHRGMSPSHLKKILRGDMDLILKKSLRKEPERRYQSTHDFREDLVRWLSGDRILARPDSVGYQISRFVRRNPLLVTLMTTVAVCSIGFTIFHVQRITLERDMAQLEAIRRMEVSDFLVNLLKVPDPTQAQGREITAQELLEDSFSRINDELSDPETKIRLLQVVGEVAQNLGLYDQADSARADVVQYAKEMHGERSLEAATANFELAALQVQARKFEAAIGPVLEALSVRRELLPAGDIEIGRALKLAALTHRDLKQYDLAEQELREAMAIIQAQLPEADPLQTVIILDLAYVLRTAGQAEEAEELYRQTIPELRRRPDDFPGDLPVALNNLAYLLRKKEDYAEAELLYREAISANENHYGEAHPSTLMFRNNLAGVLGLQGKNPEVRQELTTIIGMHEHLRGPDHWRTGSAHRSLGYFLYSVGNYKEALPELQTAREIFANGLGPEHAWTALASLQVATCLHLTGDSATADRMWLAARIILDSAAAREDRSVQANLRLLLEKLPAGEESWRQKLDDLVAAPDAGQ